MRCARRSLSAHLLQAGVAACDAEDAEIVFAELAANAAVHAPGPVETWLNVDGNDAVLHVRDHCPGFSLAAMAPKHAEEHGRGLVSVARLCRELEVTPMADGGSLIRVTLRTGHMSPAEAPSRQR